METLGSGRKQNRTKHNPATPPVSPIIGNGMLIAFSQSPKKEIWTSSKMPPAQRLLRYWTLSTVYCIF